MINQTYPGCSFRNLFIRVRTVNAVKWSNQVRSNRFISAPHKLHQRWYYLVCGASVRGVSLPKSSRVSLDVSNHAFFEIESRVPAQGSVSENPKSTIVIHNVEYFIGQTLKYYREQVHQSSSRILYAVNNEFTNFVLWKNITDRYQVCIILLLYHL